MAVSAVRVNGMAEVIAAEAKGQACLTCNQRRHEHRLPGAEGHLHNHMTRYGYNIRSYGHIWVYHMNIGLPVPRGSGMGYRLGLGVRIWGEGSRLQK